PEASYLGLFMRNADGKPFAGSDTRTRSRSHSVTAVQGGVQRRCQRHQPPPIAADSKSDPLRLEDRVPAAPDCPAEIAPDESPPVLVPLHLQYLGAPHAEPADRADRRRRRPAVGMRRA